MNRILIILMVVMASGLTWTAKAGIYQQPPNNDHKIARAALARGEVLPLEKIFRLVLPKLHDEIVGIKFEMHGNVWFYEFRTVDQAGHLHYIHANAVTGVLEAVENHP